MEQLLANAVPILLFGGVMYLLFLKPQQKRNREQKELLASIETHDEILLNSGIYGFVTDIDGDIIWVEVSEGVELKVARGAVSGKVTAADDPSSSSSDDSDDEEDEEVEEVDES